MFMDDNDEYLAEYDVEDDVPNLAESMADEYSEAGAFNVIQSAIIKDNNKLQSELDDSSFEQDITSIAGWTKPKSVSPNKQKIGHAATVAFTQSKFKVKDVTAFNA